MAVKTFFCKLLPPRPTFVQDMSKAEAKLMQEHSVYWRGWLEEGKVVAFGLVADPGGAFGMAIIEVADDSDARRLTANDPVIRADRGFKYEMFPMPRGAVHSPTGAA